MFLPFFFRKTLSLIVVTYVGGFSSSRDYFKVDRLLLTVLIILLKVIAFKNTLLCLCIYRLIINTSYVICQCITVRTLYLIQDICVNGFEVYTP